MKQKQRGCDEDVVEQRGGRDCNRKVTVVVRSRQRLWTHDREVTVVVDSRSRSDSDCAITTVVVDVFVNVQWLCDRDDCA